MEHSQLQNSPAGFFIFADDASALGTGKAGLTITVTLAKASAASNAVAPTITEVGSGWYWIVPLAAHRDTLGRNLWQFEADGAVIAGRVEKIVAFDDQIPDSPGVTTLLQRSGGVGQYQLPIAVTDDSDIPVPRAVISVYDADDRYLGIHTSTAADGTAVLQLASGTYKLGITAHPTHAPATRLITIAAADPDPLSIQLTAIATTPPGTGGLCRVRIPVREPAVAASAAQITAQLVGLNQAVGNDLLSRAVTRGETDATGYADLLLPKGLTYKIVGSHAGHEFLNLEYAVPATDEAYLAAQVP